MTVKPISDATAAIAIKPKIPRSSKIDATVVLREAQVGDWVEMHPFVHVEYAAIGDYGYLQEYVTVADSTLGRFCAIAAMTRINAPNHPHRRASQHRFTYVPEYYWSGATRDHAFFADRRAARCTIGNDVWIGHGVTIMPGIVVGDGAIIAAGAVVTKDVAPYTIAGGVPAKVIKERFPRAIAERLQRLAWWTWPPERLQQSVPDFQALDIEAFLEKHAG